MGTDYKQHADSVCMSTAKPTCMVTVQNFDVVSDKLNMVRICASGNHHRKCVYNYSFLMHICLTIYIIKIFERKIGITNNKIFSGYQLCHMVEW
jgi:hypothetical protein